MTFLVLIVLTLAGMIYYYWRALDILDRAEERRLLWNAIKLYLAFWVGMMAKWWLP